jgi:hypothetical protein
MFMLFVMNKLVRGDSCRMVFDHIQCVSLRTGIRGSAGSGEQSDTYKVYRTSAELELAPAHPKVSTFSNW